MTVGEERASAAGTLADGDHFRHAFAHRKGYDFLGGMNGGARDRSDERKRVQRSHNITRRMSASN